MVDFVKLAKTAKRLIEENGRTITVQKQGPADVTQPWREATTPTLTTVTGKAAFVDTGSLGAFWVNADNVKRSEKVALFAANNDGGNSLEDFDQIVDGSTTWKIDRTEVLQPADIRLIYMFGVSR